MPRDVFDQNPFERTSTTLNSRLKCIFDGSNSDATSFELSKNIYQQTLSPTELMHIICSMNRDADEKSYCHGVCSGVVLG